MMLYFKFVHQTHIYQMNNRMRGLVLIFNNINFRHRDNMTRDGSQHDEDALVNVFTQMNFRCQVEKDRTGKVSLFDMFKYNIYFFVRFGDYSYFCQQLDQFISL